MNTIRPGFYLSPLVVAMIFTLAASSRSAEPAAAPSAAIEWVKTEMYFGRDMPGGHQVSRSEWNDFMDKVLTKHFPKGLTILEAYGQMQHVDGRIEKQSTWMVLVVHPKDQATDKAIRNVITAYREQFHNPQAIYLSHPVTACFLAD